MVSLCVSKVEYSHVPKPPFDAIVQLLQTAMIQCSEKEYTNPKQMILEWNPVIARWGVGSDARTKRYVGLFQSNFWDCFQRYIYLFVC